MPKKKPLACPADYCAKDSTIARLLEALGREDFRLLQKHFGGERLWIPKTGARPSCAACRWRNRCVRTWRGQGLSIAVIARHLGVSAKTIYRIAKPPSP